MVGVRVVAVNLGLGSKADVLLISGGGKSKKNQNSGKRKCGKPSLCSSGQDVNWLQMRTAVSEGEEGMLF